jgi:hypothetical protein
VKLASPINCRLPAIASAAEHQMLRCEQLICSTGMTHLQLPDRFGATSLIAVRTNATFPKLPIDYHILTNR